MFKCKNEISIKFHIWNETYESNTSFFSALSLSKRSISVNDLSPAHHQPHHHHNTQMHFGADHFGTNASPAGSLATGRRNPPVPGSTGTPTRVPPPLIRSRTQWSWDSSSNGSAANFGAELLAPSSSSGNAVVSADVTAVVPKKSSSGSRFSFFKRTPRPPKPNATLAPRATKMSNHLL